MPRRRIILTALSAPTSVLARIAALVPIVGLFCSTHGQPSASTRLPRLITPHFELVVQPSTGQWLLTDRASGVTWESNPNQPRFATAQVRFQGQSHTWQLQACEVTSHAHQLTALFRPKDASASTWLYVRAKALGEGRILEWSYEASANVQVESLQIFDDAFGITDQDHGYVAVPVREGLLIPSDSMTAFTHRFDTYNYEGCHMAMLGLVKRGSAILATWDDPYVAPEIRSEVSTVLGVRRQRLSTSVALSHGVRRIQTHVLGPGSYVDIAKAYRAEAQARGWWVPWSRKIAGHPSRAELFGTINFKLWSTLSRKMSEDSKTEESVRVNWTFEEAAQVAEHLKRDLKLDRVLFMMGGWIRRGYDNQHPDILPAAPECGGNEGLAACARRVRDLGYVFCLHDNYQDLYRDSPSWDERYLMRKRDGSLAVGGSWAGGRAYLTCSPKALELARRPQNLPAVFDLTRAPSYFIDTTYAAGLQECFDPQHPLTRRDDLYWKQALSDYARSIFGIFGSECGREWAIPHSDFFEGITGVSGGHFHDAGLLKKVGGIVVPLFELVYHDTIAAYGKYGYKIEGAAEYVLHHLLFGRTLNYHSIPSHLYWTNTPPTPPAVAPTDGPDPALFVRGESGWTEGMHPLDRFVKNTYEIMSPLCEFAAQMPMADHAFLDPDHTVQRSVFRRDQNTISVVVNLGKKDWTVREGTRTEAVLPPYGFLISSPTFVAFHARVWRDNQFSDPACFTLRSLDGRPIHDADSVRVFHAFGDRRLRVRGTLRTVERESVFSVVRAR